MPKEGQNIFKRVAVSEKKIIFREIAAAQLLLSLKNEFDEIFSLRAMQTENDQSLLCHHTENSKDKTQAGKVVVNFMYKNERFFFHTNLTFGLGWAILNTDVDLFQLQRRANARIEVPPSYTARFTLISYGKKIIFMDTRLTDISAGGMKLEIEDPSIQFKASDKGRGVLTLGTRRPTEFDVEFKHVMQKEENGLKKQIAGVQFLNIDNIMENRLLSLMMDFQRELYVKF